MNAEAETESASLDWLFDVEVLLSNDTVGSAVGVALEPQAESTSPMMAVAMNILVNRPLRLRNSMLRVLFLCSAR